MNGWRGMAAGMAALVALVGFTAGAAAQGKGDPKAGETLYKNNKCATCHGDIGAGDGPQGQKLKDKPSNWKVSGGGLKGMDDQKIFDSIAKGGPAVGKSRAMPASSKLSDDEVWSLVAYVKTLTK
jgi:high-affinity iron transporter